MSTYLGPFGLRIPKERCIAEIGRPGHYHGCNRLAHWQIRSRHGMLLHYCDRHIQSRVYAGSAPVRITYP